jgi:hypothetical protein
MGRSRVGRQQWLAWVSEQAESGLSVKQFCDERQIPLQSFYLWRRKVRGVENASAGAFVEVSIKQPVAQVEIELPCGATLRGLEADEALRRVLRALLELGRPS